MMTCYALYVADEPGTMDDAGIEWTCVCVFGDVDNAIEEGRTLLVRDGRSVFIEVGEMTDAEWDALEEIPDDFRFTPTGSVQAEEPEGTA